MLRMSVAPTRKAFLSSLVGGVRWLSSSSPSNPLRLAIVGTGPAGFYSAKYLLKGREDVQVDLIDALPTPFGLVRSGVAPDHPEVKSVQNDFEEVATDPRLNFLGNVSLGKDISVDVLRQHYNGVILAYGAASDRWLNIPGESLNNVHSARAFVNWYNGHPDFVDFKPNLECEDVVIVGQGNVAIDCARILAKTPEELASTDIAAHALEALSNSRIKRVHVVGRRGHVQAAFTIKELREVTRLEDATCDIDPDELAMGLTSASLEELSSTRAKKRINDLLTKVADAPRDDSKTRSLAVRFLVSPIELQPSASDPDSVGGVVLERNTLMGDVGGQWAEGTGRTETLDAGMVLKSIGYKSVAVDGVPFDTTRHVVHNTKGAVTTEDGAPVPGLFCVGWLKRGPSGIIGTNIPDAKQTVNTVLAEAEAGSLPDVTADKPGLEGVTEAVVAGGKPASQLIDWEGYQRIDAAEVEKGKATGKPREKLVDLEEMLRVANGV